MVFFLLFIYLFFSNKKLGDHDDDKHETKTSTDRKPKNVYFFALIKEMRSKL